MKLLNVVSAIALLSLNAAAYADDKGLESCVAAIQKQKPGAFLKLEKLKVAGQPVYEFEVKEQAGTEWEFMCSAKSGKIIETETEADSAESPAFKDKAKVSEADASATALKAYPGKIEEVEYEIESNGDVSYEFDILSDKGVETKVEVDAVSGKIIEQASETWEIGEEADERK